MDAMCFSEAEKQRLLGSLDGVILEQKKTDTRLTTIETAYHTTLKLSGAMVSLTTVLFGLMLGVMAWVMLDKFAVLSNSQTDIVQIKTVMAEVKTTVNQTATRLEAYRLEENIQNEKIGELNAVQRQLLERLNE